jgi:hypothetical protein
LFQCGEIPVQSGRIYHGKNAYDRKSEYCLNEDDADKKWGIWLCADDLCYRPGGPPLLALKSYAPTGDKATTTTTFPGEGSDGAGGKLGQ